MRSFCHFGTALTVLISMMIADPVAAQSAPAVDPQKVSAAYNLAVRCFIADGFAAGNRKSDNDPDREQYFDKKADDASAAGLKVGAILGYTSKRFVDDTWSQKDALISRFNSDPQYFTQVANECKAYGLM